MLVIRGPAEAGRIDASLGLREPQRRLLDVVGVQRGTRGLERCFHKTAGLAHLAPAIGRNGRAEHQQQDCGDGGHGRGCLIAANPFASRCGEAGTSGGDCPVVHEPPQVVGQILSRRVTIGCVFFDCFMDDGGQVGGDRGYEPLERRRVEFGDGAQELGAVGGVERWPTGDEFV